jgi:hypothetical protein
MLEITVPAAPEAKPRNIQIETAPSAREGKRAERKAA